MWADSAYLKQNTLMRNENTEAHTRNIIWYSSSLCRIGIQNKRELTHSVGQSESLIDISFNGCYQLIIFHSQHFPNGGQTSQSSENRWSLIKKRTWLRVEASFRNYKWPQSIRNSLCFNRTHQSLQKKKNDPCLGIIFTFICPGWDEFVSSTSKRKSGQKIRGGKRHLGHRGCGWSRVRKTLFGFQRSISQPCVFLTASQ